MRREPAGRGPELRSRSGTRGRRLAVTLVALSALVGAGCSKSSGSSSSAGGKAPAVKTDIGVSATEIQLGVLTDLSGQFAALGKGTVQGLQLFWDDQNSRDPVCGRKVVLNIRDHGYNAQTAVSLYADLKDKVLGLNQSLGSPMTTALLPSILQDHMLTEPVSWASSLLKNQYIVMDGTTYDLEIINGIDWLMKNRGLKDGDSVGYIYQEGEYGDNGFAGGQYSASKHNLKLVPQKIKGTDTDMTAQIAAIKASGAKFILMTSGPKQSASAASVAKSTGYDVTILSSNPGYAPTLLDTPAKDALEQTFYVVASSAPFSGDAPGVTKVRNAFNQRFGSETPNAGVDFGYGQAQIFYRIINQACQNGDLTRDGLFRAFQSLKNVETDGIIAPLDYTQSGQPPCRQVYVAQPSAAEKGGLKQVAALFESDDARAYTLK